MMRRVAMLSMLVLLSGCDAQDDGGIRRAGQRVGETVTDFAKGVGKGVDNRLEVPVQLAEQVSNLGLRITVAKTGSFGDAGPKVLQSTKTITVYFIASRPVKEWLRAKALNAQGDEVGRSTVEVELGAEDAKYVTFSFDQEMDVQRVDKYVVEIGKPVTSEPKTPAANPAADPAAAEPAKQE